MAQTGYTPILIYSSSTTTNAPSAGNLTNSTLGSELAINITDGKLFYKDNTNNVQVIAWKTTPTSAGGTGLTSYTAGDLLYYATGTTFSKLAIGTSNQVLTSSGTAPQWSTNLNIGSLTATSLTTTGNLTFSSTAQFITGDTSNATISNRLFFQGSVANTRTNFNIVPNGTNTNAGVDIYSNAADVANSAQFRIINTGTETQLISTRTGSTVSYLPMAFYVSGSTKAMQIHNSAGISIGNTTDPGATNLSVTGTGTFGTTIGVGAATPATSGAGITFPATQSASTNANTLDDYEEGTFAPVVTTGSGTITSYTSDGRYTKIGNLVTFLFEINITNNGTGATDVRATLPFTNSAQESVGSGRENAVTGNMLQIYAGASSTSVRIFTYNNLYPGGTNYAIYGTLTYQV